MQNFNEFLEAETCVLLCIYKLLHLNHCLPTLHFSCVVNWNSNCVKFLVTYNIDISYQQQFLSANSSTFDNNQSVYISTMVMALDGLTRLCPLILFDWRLYAERGCPRFFHTHNDAKRTDDCELGFLKQVNTNLSLYFTFILRLKNTKLLNLQNFSIF